MRKLVPDPSVQFENRLARAIAQISNLGRDLQSLSHRLHSSNLKYLGLASAVFGHCRELADQYNVHIEVESNEIPDDLPEEVSLCVFRVLQEALQNAVKHSGSQHFEVSLFGGSGDLLLTVHDSGIGFDPAETTKGPGLGLTSIRERMKLVDGELSIESGQGDGTTIQVRVPLKSRARTATV